MADWLILAVAHLLKAAILGGLALVSWGVDVVTPSPDRDATEAAWVTGETALGTPCVCILAAETPDTTHLDLRGMLSRLEAAVPPIRVEAVYSPDVLCPPGPPPTPAVAVRIPRDAADRAG